MNWHMLITIIFACCSAHAEHAPQHSDEESFLRAASLYKRHSYDKALELYSSLAHPGAPVFYNIGNCYYHQKKYAHALVNWRRAQRHASCSLLADINYNIRCLLSDMNKPMPSGFKTSFDTWMQCCAASVPPLLLQLLLIAVLLALCMCCYLRLHSWLLIVLLLMLGVADFTLITYVYDQQNTQRAVVVSSQVQVHAGPGENYAIVDSLQVGDELTIGKSEDTWYKICHGYVSGWLPAHTVEIV